MMKWMEGEDLESYKYLSHKRMKIFFFFKKKTLFWVSWLQSMSEQLVLVGF